MQDKIKTLAEMKEILAKQRKAGKSIVFANGCFDLLHVGHVRYLEAARALGDTLVLGLNGDESVQVLKGTGRPLMTEAERAETVAALQCVDYVIVFSDPTADRILHELQPEVHAKGTDYTEATVPERDTVLRYGGRIAIVGDPKNHSTREFLRRIATRLTDESRRPRYD
jgi:D-glycero-beta-D-manno-heptose 1-phosphate adenylyltransferase